MIFAAAQVVVQAAAELVPALAPALAPAPAAQRFALVASAQPVVVSLTYHAPQRCAAVPAQQQVAPALVPGPALAPAPALVVQQPAPVAFALRGAASPITHRVL